MEKERILVCYNEPFNYYDNYHGKEVDLNSKSDLSETEFRNNLDHIVNLLKNNYSIVETLGFTSDIKDAINKIEKFLPDVIYNFVESIEGNARFEIYVTGIYELLGISYTGNNPLCLANCLIKNRTKQILISQNIPTPNYFLIKKEQKINEIKINLKYPVILKLATEDASIGISENSVVYNHEELKKQIKYLIKNFNQDILAEEYIRGRELNVAFLDGTILPISEINFNGLPQDLPAIVTYEAKWSPETVYYKFSNPICPAILDEEIKTKVIKIAIEAYNALECRDYARVDIRLSEDNIPYVIEVNPNPDISPDAGFVRAAKAAGISYESLLFKISQCAIKRIQNDSFN